MMAARNSEISQSLMDALNAHDVDAIVRLYTPDFAGEDIALATKFLGPDDVRLALTRSFGAFPDLQITQLDAIQHQDRLAQCWQARGTHSDKFMHIPPTGRQITVRGASFLTVRNGQISTATVIWDLAGLLRSLGLLPDL